MSGGSVRWDALVKLTHWGTALAVLANALVLRPGSDWHIWAGYGVAALLGLRMLWGFVGPVEARFASFPPSPGCAIRHIRGMATDQSEPHRSHNPLGALMVYALWITLGVIVATGLAMAGPSAPDGNTQAIIVAGDERASVPVQTVDATTAQAEERGEWDEDHEEESDDEGESGWEEAHEMAVNLLYVLVALHVLGVMFESRRTRSPLIRAMLPGRPA